jgi:hypothetical protein
VARPTPRVRCRRRAAGSADFPVRRAVRNGAAGEAHCSRQGARGRAGMPALPAAGDEPAGSAPGLRAHLGTAPETRPVDSLSAIRWGRGPGRGGALACWPAPLPHPLPARASQGEGGARGDSQRCPRRSAAGRSTLSSRITRTSMKPTARAKALVGGQECPPSRPPAMNPPVRSPAPGRIWAQPRKPAPWTPSPPSDGGEGRGEVAPLRAGLPLSPTLSPLVPRRAREAPGVVPRGGLAAPSAACLLSCLLIQSRLRR